MSGGDDKLVLALSEDPGDQLEFSFDELWGQEGECLSEDPRSDMKRILLQGRFCFLKRFRYLGLWDSFLRRFRGSHCQREARNFIVLRSLGVPCPEVLLWAEDESWFFLRRAMLVTRAIPQTSTLESQLMSGSLDAASRRRLVLCLAEQVATMHEAGYLDRDLKFRNILVDSTLRLHHVDSPQGRSHPGRLGLKMASRDLGTLMKHAPRYFQPREMLRFLALYGKRRQLSGHERRQLLILVKSRSANLHRRAGSSPA